MTNPRTTRFATHLVGGLTLAVSLTALGQVARATTPTIVAHAPAAAAAAGILPTAAPVGHLAPTGCVRTGTADACDLWARAGTANILGTSIPIWGYATTASGPVTAPGPVLAVAEGDTVTVTLHNQLNEPSSLSLPGQPAASFAGDVPSGVLAGVPSGGTATWTFTASRPGTFLYQAGHTSDVARQVAMGLAGALVVLPSGSGAYDSGQTAYDDEAVLVLSEVDPALNTAPDPSTFDMRQFKARYRMINGKVFPSTDPVPTGPGRTVLLRYVDAGILPHSMGVLGASQVRIAQDGEPAPHPTTALVADLAAGQTADTLVTMPGAVEGPKVTVYETGGQLDNDGMTEADPTRVAAGGMMTFLDTAAPPPSTDTVGPVPARVTVSPNPSDGRVPVTVTATVSDTTTGGSNVDAAEFVLDDPGATAPGFGATMTPADGRLDSATEAVVGTIPVGASADPTYCATNPVTLSCLSAGKHRVFVRAHDAAGNWGVVSDATLDLPKVGPLTSSGAVHPDPTNGSAGLDVTATGDDSVVQGVVDRAEWSIDTPSGAGSGNPMTVGSSAATVALSAHVPTGALSGLAEGTHHLFLRSHDSLGIWGPVLDVPFTLDRTGPIVTAAAAAPNPTNGKLSAPGSLGNLVVSASITDAAGGLVKGGEGFIDPGTAPAPGSGFRLDASDGSYDSSTESVVGLVPLSAVSSLSEGTHRVVVRGLDNAGNWGPLFTAPLVVDRTPPTLGVPAVTPTPSNGAATIALTASTSEAGLNAAEVWVGADPGVGKATPETISVNTAGNRVTITMAVPPFTVGARTVHVRIQDKAGNWSKPRAVEITLTGGAAPAGSAAARLGFATTIGNVAVDPSRGVAFSPTANTPAYATTTTTTPAHGFSADLTVDRGTVRTATGSAMTLFDGRTAGGTGVFALQLRSTSPTTASVRGVLTRSDGSLTMSPWVALPAGPQHLVLTWASGPAAAAAATPAGGLRVVVGSTVVANLTGDTATVTLAAIRLGVVGGLTTAATAAMSGVLYVDHYGAQGVQ